MATLPANAVDALPVIVGLGLAAGGVVAVLGLLYRWYVGEGLPTGIAVLLGFSVVAIHLNTTAALGHAIAEREGLFSLNVALVNSTAFGLALLASIAGARIGERTADSLSALGGARELDRDVSRVVTAVGRAIAVTLPEDIEDIQGYDPVDPAVKESLSGKTLLFPRRLTVAELRDRLVTRLKEDYAVGHVSLDMADDGTIEHLGLGSRAAGIGPTLPPGTSVTAIRGDPPYAASSGDVVQVWTRGEDPDRIATAEVRAKAEDVVTVALDSSDAESIRPGSRYRLVTLPQEPRVDREFASLLRAADETFGVVTVTEGSPLLGTPVAALGPTVVAIGSASGGVEAIPSGSHVVSANDTIYAVARPEELRRLEAGARAEAEPSL